MALRNARARLDCLGRDQRAAVLASIDMSDRREAGYCQPEPRITYVRASDMPMPEFLAFVKERLEKRYPGAEVQTHSAPKPFVSFVQTNTELVDCNQTLKWIEQDLEAEYQERVLGALRPATTLPD
jgi:hypothetical protein